VNEQNTKKLLADFPRLYRDHSKPMSETCMCWGFSCGDGWYDLLHKLSADIETASASAGLDRDSDGWPRATQVKEKFGTLRFYVDVTAPPKVEDLEVDQATAPSGFIAFRPVASVKAIRDLVETAEAASATICEECGAPGSLRQGGWWHTYCDACEAEYLASKAKEQQEYLAKQREKILEVLTSDELAAIAGDDLDRTYKLGGVVVWMLRICSGVDEAREWLYRPHDKLGSTPFDVMSATPDGLDELLGFMRKRDKKDD